MCLPACAACTMKSAWVSVEEQISTASISGFAKICSLDSATVGIPQRAANACAASRLTIRDSQCPDFRQTERQSFGMDLTDAPGADDSDIQLFCAQWVLFGMTYRNWLRWSAGIRGCAARSPSACPCQAECPVPPERSRRSRAPRAAAAGREIHTTLTEFAEDSVAQGGEVIPLRRPAPGALPPAHSPCSGCTRRGRR